MQVLGAGKGLHDQHSYENQVLQEIAQYEEGEKQLRRQQQQQDDEADNESTHRQTDSVLEASLVIAF